MSLDTKYRPKSFADVLGQDATVASLKNFLKGENKSRVFLFSGLHGGGKTTTARIFARAILCPNRGEDGEPCNECDVCKAHIEDRLQAYSEINGADSTKADDFRELLSSLRYKPFDSDWRIFLVDEAHQLSKASMNLLLKPLEEAQGDVFYLFCTTDPDKMLPTVRSRCIEFAIQRTPDELLLERLKSICAKEAIEADERALGLLVKYSRGHIRDALKTIERLSSFGPISFDLVKEHFELDSKVVIYDILLALRDSVADAVKLSDAVLKRMSAPDLMSGMVAACIAAYRANIDALPPDMPDVEAEKARVLGGELGPSVVDIADHLAQSSRYTDANSLVCDLMVISHKLRHGFGAVFREVVVERQVAAEPAVAPAQPAEQKSITPSEPAPEPSTPVAMFPAISSLDSQVAVTRNQAAPLPVDPAGVTSPAVEPMLTPEQAALLFQTGKYAKTG